MPLTYVLRCGSAWDHITKGLGCEWVVSCAPEEATVFGTREEAEAMKRRLESRPYSAIHEVVEVQAIRTEESEGVYAHQK